jgi:hypothetical protein
MAITRKPDRKPTSADDFISGAPDAGTAKAAARGPGVEKGRKVQITVTFPRDLIAEIDALKARTGLSRAAIINIGARHVVRNGITLDALADDSD